MMICEDMILNSLLCTVSIFAKGIMKIVDVRRRFINLYLYIVSLSVHTSD